MINKLRSTFGRATDISPPDATRRLSRKYRAMVIFVAIGTNMMKRLGRLVLRLERVNQDASAQWIHLVATLCIFPLSGFYLLVSKVTIRVQQLMILRLQRENYALELGNFIV